MYSCEICNYSTDRAANYTRHMSSKKHLKIAANGKLEGNNIKKFYCQYCDKHFKDKYDAKRHQETDKHYKKRAELYQQVKNETPKEERPNVMNKIKVEAWKKEYIHIDRKIKDRSKPTKKPKYIFNPEDFANYCYLTTEQMKTLIMSFVQYIEIKKADIENYINYEDWQKDDEEDTTNLYIELYEYWQR